MRQQNIFVWTVWLRFAPQAGSVWNNWLLIITAQAKDEPQDIHMQVQPVSGNTTEYRFELKAKDGYLDVYHYHTDNLFFHTGIPYSALTVDQRQELEHGIYFVNEQEMYGYLESCTS